MIISKVWKSAYIERYHWDISSISKKDFYLKKKLMIADQCKKYRYENQSFKFYKSKFYRKLEEAKEVIYDVNEF